MRKQKRIIALGLSISFMLGTLAACSTENQASSSVSENTNTPSASTEVEQAKLTTITYWDAFCANMEENSYTESLIEAALPVDIVVNRTDNVNITQVSNLLTEKNMPDVMWYNESTEFMLSLDITRTIPMEMVEEYAPSFLELYNNNPTIYTSIMNPENTDEFFALNGTTDQATRVACSQYADFYRYDWIQNLGIDLGVEVTQISDNIYVADTGLTLDKFEEVMDGFTNGDPDANGKDDTYGGALEWFSRYDTLYSGFGLLNGINEFNGEAEMYYATDMFKDFTIWMADNYSKGYFGEELHVFNRNARWDAVLNGEAGYFTESSIALNTWASDRPPLSLIEKDPTATFLLTPGLSDNNGQGTMLKNAMPTRNYICYISKNVDDEKLATILQTLEYMNFGDEKLSMWFGEENVDWEFDDKGNVEVLNVLSPAEKGSTVFVQNVQTGVLFDAVNMQDTFAKGADFWLDDCIWRENDREQYQYKLDLMKETDYSELYLEYNAPSFAIMQEYFSDWVYNGLNVEESWDDYLQSLDQAGYNLMMAELDKVDPLEDMILDFVT